MTDLSERLKKAIEFESWRAAESYMFSISGDDYERHIRDVYIKGSRTEHARRKPLLLALVELLDCADEVNGILGDCDARKEIDSFTNQNLNIALAAVVREIEKIEGMK